MPKPLAMVFRKLSRIPVSLHKRPQFVESYSTGARGAFVLDKVLRQAKIILRLD
ncbi:MAG: hypothetical protein LBF22_02760 [Deltaproteobacteria bacterium]|nr:hypothetical protein [Deltaproteobacteria bacterium]